MSPLQFRPANRRQAKLRLALMGVSGGGKTFTAQSIASTLAGEDGRIAVIDTERGSASLYSDHFKFDVIELAPPFEPHVLVEAIKLAEKEGYDVLIIDSLSHFWEGEGGVLEIVDNAAAKARGNSWAGWSEGTPAYRNMIDTFLGADLHVIGTMRSKTEWVIEKGSNGKDKPVRIGMAPVMRGGIEYEFTAIGELDLDHRLTITKSRVEQVADKVYHAHREVDLAETLKSWLGQGIAPAGRAEIEGIKEILAAIPDPDLRTKAKLDFVAEFGMPDFLTADQADAAIARAEALAMRVMEGGSQSDPTTGEGTSPATEPTPADSQATGLAAEAHDTASNFVAAAKPEPIDRALIDTIGVLFTDMEVPEREYAQRCAVLVGHPVLQMADLTFDEGQFVIDTLRSLLDTAGASA
jgi:hypothetical protein